VFSPDFRPSVVANGAATARELGGFWSVTGDHASDVYTGQSQLPPLANESTITLADLAGHDNITSISIHIVDLHTNDFMLR
jgi:hypothetical protein